MSEISKRKNTKTSRRQMVQGAQREHLLEAMKQLLSTNKKEIHKKAVWENIANELNKLGPVKEPVRWRKCWSDLLLRLRKRIVQQQEKFQIISLDNKNCYEHLKLSADDVKILDCYGGIELLFKDCIRKTRDGKIETISIADSSENSDFNYDNHDNDSQMTYSFNNKIYGNTNTSTPVKTPIETVVVKVDIPEIYENNNKIINNKNDDIFKNSRIIDNQIIVEKNNNNNNLTINQDSSSNHLTNEMNQSSQFVDNIRESLDIQKQTFEEIRRLSVIQQETNNLIRILINRLTTQPINTNENNLTGNRIPDESNLSMLSVKLEEINHNGNV